MHSPQQTFRIAVLSFMHETVTFLPNDTTRDDFVYPGSPCRDEQLLAGDTRGYITGFAQFAREMGCVELVGIESPQSPKTGTGSGWITRDAFEHFVGEMLADLKARGPFDGVYMALHGAMGVRGIARPEAELAARVRAAVGPGVVLAATFDLHANEDSEFLRHADLAFSVKYYPHYDGHLQGERAARTMLRVLRGTYAPTASTVKVPLIVPTVLQWTGASPWMDVVQRALVWEARKPGTVVNVLFGFPWADVPDIGMTVQAIANGDAALAQEIAHDMADFIWRRRERLLKTADVLPIDEGVARAQEWIEQGIKPVVIADHSDRSGYATWVLQAVLQARLPRVLVGSVADRELIARLAQRGIEVGDAFDEPVGGRVDPSAGPAVRIAGQVLAVSSTRDAGSPGPKWIVVGFGAGNALVISQFLMQVKEPEAFTAMGLDLRDFDVFVIKSRVHFRRGFDDSGFAKAIALVEPAQPFLGTTRLEGLAYRNVDLSRYYPYGNPPTPATRGEERQP
jgi:microcystin degradation protein MlrC